MYTFTNLALAVDLYPRILSLKSSIYTE